MSSLNEHFNETAASVQSAARSMDNSKGGSLPAVDVHAGSVVTLQTVPMSTMVNDDDSVAQLAHRLGKDFEVIESPNCGDRRGKGAGQKPSELVMHYTACEKERVIDLFQKRDNASSHYLVDCQGNITRFVDESKRAWHAGVGSWHGNTDVNSTSIGIENVNLGYQQHPKDDLPGEQVEGDARAWYAYDEELLNTLTPLCQDIVEQYEIQPNNIIGHSDMATDRYGSLGRKVDPGSLFPWETFYRQYNLGAWYNLKESLEDLAFPHQNQTEWVRQHLVKYGYPHPNTGWNEENTKQAVKTFQMHFRPKNISGIVDHETLQILASLVDRYIENKP